MTNRKLKIGILGFGGRMGSEIAKLLGEAPYRDQLETVSAPGRSESNESLFRAEVVVEFSSPAAVIAFVREAIIRNSKVPLVVGATGWTEAELRELDSAAVHFPILRSANFSLGVSLCRAALRNWASFPEIDGWSVTIRDLHHAKKKDAPSGTALALRDALRPSLRASAVIESEREGDAIGTHEVILESPYEKVTLIHEAKSRAVFAKGAIDAAIRLANLDPAVLPKRVLGLDDLYLRGDA